ncbi:MAG: hypothetical protein ACHQ1G_00525 [Planctomycetota bacterium]
MSKLRFVYLTWRRSRNERLPRERLLERNLGRFRKLVRFVARRSPFYAAVIRERGIDPARARPEDFPVLAKETLIERFDEIATDPRVRREPIERFLASSHDARQLFEGRFVVVHSSGSSGRVSCVAYSPDEWLQAAAQFERIIRVGLRKKIAFVGATQGHYAGVSFATALTSPLSRLLYVTRAFDVNRPRDDTVADLNAFAPRVLVSYARVLVELAEAKARGELRISPKAIVSGGEPLLRADRDFLRRTFRADVRDTYATSEHLYMGFDLPHGKPGMFLAEDDLILEVMDDGLLCTNLFNRTVPLIRHRIDDVISPPPADAGAHGPYRVVGGISGRHEAAPVFTNERGREDTINPHVIGEIFVKGLRGFQLRQTDRTSFRFLVMLDPAERGRARHDLEELWNALLAKKAMRNVRFTIEEVEALERDPTVGKFRLIVPA